MSRADPTLFDPARGLFVAPIRHHSPACATHLAAMIAELRPRAILIEGPCDYDALIPVLLDAATRPPVAIVSLVDRPGGVRRVVSYYPFCAHSPEYVGLAAAAQRGVPARFIDLPSDHAAMLSDDSEADNPAPSGDEHRFDSGDYVRALARTLGCRDGNEVWDHLFESRAAGDDWRSFFGDVGRYCAHLRVGTDEASIAADGTLAREAQMRSHIEAALGEGEGGRVLAVVGGFHAPALGPAPRRRAGPGRGRARLCYPLRLSTVERAHRLPRGITDAGLLRRAVAARSGGAGRAAVRGARDRFADRLRRAPARRAPRLCGANASDRART